MAIVVNQKEYLIAKKNFYIADFRVVCDFA